MAAQSAFTLNLRKVFAQDGATVGGKASTLSRLADAGMPVPNGFCITAEAYAQFLKQGRLESFIHSELGRKPLKEMRWEEMWDAALRIRSKFLSSEVPANIITEIDCALEELGPGPLAVRSSALDEDSAGRTFAGLHESVVGVEGRTHLLDAVKIVWASLWSDAALLYRVELNLDPYQSRMAVLVQQYIPADVAGVAFGRDPRGICSDNAVIEAVPGSCGLLVDGLLDPDRWEVSRTSRRIVSWHAGDRDDHEKAEPLLSEIDMQTLVQLLFEVEQATNWAPDMEWAERGGSFSLLQARPITTGSGKTEDERDWYLTLRPSEKQLRALRTRVAEELIPELEQEGEVLASEAVEQLDDALLANAIERRTDLAAKWKAVYWKDFIPFAHGVRRLGHYYNDAVQPADPYEFVGLLANQQMIASQRNSALEALAKRLQDDPALKESVRLMLESAGTEEFLKAAAQTAHAQSFYRDLERVKEQYFDVTLHGARLNEKAESLLQIVHELSAADRQARSTSPRDIGESRLESKLLAAVGDTRKEEALEVIETARLSWKLRDDDNLLLAKIESQQLRAVSEGANRLHKAGRIVREAGVNAGDAAEIVKALRDSEYSPRVDPRESAANSEAPQEQSAEMSASPRQISGQPASKGFASGRVRVIRKPEDLAQFRKGEILVCDAIQPMMTHIVPLAAGIVERRGGMLIHGAIIARELGIPCVNGVRSAVDQLTDGQQVSVDGYLGLVTVGTPEFDLELSSAGRYLAGDN